LKILPKRYLIYPANFWLHKNHERLINAFKIASDGNLDSDIKLVCTGTPGARKDYLVDMSHRVGIEDRIIFPGYLTNEDLSALMRSSVGLIFPSLYEGFGMPLIEAMAAGVPIACSNSTSLPEVVGNAGQLFDPQEQSQIAMAIVNLVGNEPLRENLISNGLVRAHEFSDIERMAKEYWELFQSVYNEERQK
jgi:glycosyltransferase involved in cell wall biosynthesis